MDSIKIFLVVVVLLVLFVIFKFNTYIRLKNKIKQSKSGIDVFLTQRFDLIPNLVECVKDYQKYEAETLSKIIKLRTEYLQDKQLKKGEELNNECNKILATAENVPELKSNEQYSNLQKNLTRIESQLQAARRVYNGDVTLYNTTIRTFPDKFLAKIFGFKEEELFQIEEYKRENINVDLENK